MSAEKYLVYLDGLDLTKEEKVERDHANWYHKQKDAKNNVRKDNKYNLIQTKKGEENV